MACSSCGNKPNTSTTRLSVEPVVENTTEDEVVLASEDPTNKVKIRYYGGGVKKTTTTGCSTCRGGKSGGYSLQTTETIQFVSMDSPNNWFKQTFSVGHDYYVTEKQAEYLLKLEYINKAGQRVKKFLKEE